MRKIQLQKYTSVLLPENRIRTDPRQGDAEEEYEIIYRYEATSDPADEATVLCNRFACGIKGFGH